MIDNHTTVVACATCWATVAVADTFADRHIWAACLGYLSCFGGFTLGVCLLLGAIGRGGM